VEDVLEWGRALVAGWRSRSASPVVSARDVDPHPALPGNWETWTTEAGFWTALQLRRRLAEDPRRPSTA